MRLPQSMLHDGLVDVTTTSVGRILIADTYTSFLDHVHFTGRFRMIVTIDPAYNVDGAELASTRAFLADLRGHPMVAEVIVEDFQHRAGLAGALMVLISHARTPIGFHLEDDWVILDTIDLDAMIADLLDQDSAQICLANTHVARGGTFDAPGAVEHLTGTRVPLLRFTAASWAAPYLPLCPHLHRTDRWAPTVAHALATSDPLRCPDERIKEHLSSGQSVASHNVLWTRQILARDTGRRWLAERGLAKSVHPAHAAQPPRAELPVSGHVRRLVAARSADMMRVAARAQPGSPVHTAVPGKRLFFDRGLGAIVWDIDGSAYVDFDCGNGTAILGHNHPTVTSTIRERAAKGVRLPLGTASALTAAQLLADVVPGSQAAHLTSTAEQARRLAVNLARRATGRDRVLYSGTGTGRDEPAAAHSAPLDTAEAALALPDVVGAGPWAAVVVRPPLYWTLGSAVLQGLRRACDEAGSLLVFDETDTTFRAAPEGLCALHGITADLVCLSTAVAAGMPLAGLVGREDILRHLSGPSDDELGSPDLLSIEVGKAVLRDRRRQPHHDHISHLGRQLSDGINEHAARFGWHRLAAGYPGMPSLRFSADPQPQRALLARFTSNMAARGVLIGGDVLFVTAAHTSDQIQFAVDAAAESLQAVAAATSRSGR